MAKKHKQMLVPLKRAMVDEQIVPIVQWLNAKTGIVTTYSCQGNDKEKHHPYIQFYVYPTYDMSFEKILKSVMEPLSRFNGVKFEVALCNGSLRCHLDLCNESLRKCLNAYCIIDMKREEGIDIEKVLQEMKCGK